MMRLAFGCLLATLGAGVLLGFIPVVAVRLIVKMYPPHHPRRRELVAEVVVVPYRDRITWIMQCIALGATEGRELRHAERRAAGRPRLLVAFGERFVGYALVAAVTPVLLILMVMIKFIFRLPLTVRSKGIGQHDTPSYRLNVNIPNHPRLSAVLHRSGMADFPAMAAVARGDLRLVGALRSASNWRSDEPEYLSDRS